MRIGSPGSMTGGIQNLSGIEPLGLWGSNMGPVSAHVTSGWLMEQGNGATRLDCITPGGMDVADNNTCLQVTGKINFGAGFVPASSQYLSHADSTVLSLGGGSFSISGWMYFTTVLVSTSYYTMVGKFSDSGVDYGYALFARPGNGQILADIGYSNNTNWVHPVWGGMTFNATTWYHIVLTHDESLQQDTVYYNSASQGALANTHGSRDDGNQFQIGAVTAFNNGDPLGTRNFMNGRLDSIYLFKGYVLTQSDVNALYNGGSGADYPTV